jgi:hypothetical protein
MDSVFSQVGLPGTNDGGMPGEKDLGATHGNGVCADRFIEPS